MPNVDITSVMLSSEDKRNLGKALTQVFCDKAGCGASAVHLRFHPVEPDDYMIGGRRISSVGAGSPVFEINVAWYDTRTSLVQETVAATLTEEASRIVNIDRETVEVNFSLLKRENHFEGGKRAPVLSQ